MRISEDMSVDINNCIIDGEYLIVKYKYRYLDKEIFDVSGSGRIYLNIDGEDKEKENISEEDRGEIIKMYNKYGGDNRESCILIEKIGDSKNVEIGCYDGSSIEILKEQAFTVTKK